MHSTDKKCSYCKCTKISNEFIKKIVPLYVTLSPVIFKFNFKYEYNEFIADLNLK